MKSTSAEMLNAAGKAYGDILREYRKKKGMSQEQVGLIAGVKKNAVGAWEAGRSRPDVASIPALCKALELPLNVFFGLSDDPIAEDIYQRFSRLNPYNRQVILTQMDSLYELQSPFSAKVVRLFQNDLSASAGPNSQLNELSGEMVYLVKNKLTSLANEIIRVSGDSMEPTYHDGDKVLVQYTSNLQEGDIGIFINGDDGYIKEYRHDGLYSHNTAYPPIRFNENDSVRLVGKVIGILTPDMIIKK